MKNPMTEHETILELQTGLISLLRQQIAKANTMLNDEHKISYEFATTVSQNLFEISIQFKSGDHYIAVSIPYPDRKYLQANIDRAITELLTSVLDHALI